MGMMELEFGLNRVHFLFFARPGAQDRWSGTPGADLESGRQDFRSTKMNEKAKNFWKPGPGKAGDEEG